MGDNFVWFVGQVVSRDDPLMLGRLKVRILKDHGTKDDIPDDDLPWSSIIMPVTKSSTLVEGGNAVGSFSLPINGTWVIGFYADGFEKQQPMIWGTIPGAPLGASGEVDPRTVPSDIPFEARGIKTTRDTPLTFEPFWALIGAQSSAYPYNKVDVTESGHLMEFDDTPGYERINIRHRSGSYRTFAVNGDVVDKVEGTLWEVVKIAKLAYYQEGLFIQSPKAIVISGKEAVMVQSEQVLSLQAGTAMTISAGALLTISAPLVMIN